MCQKTLLLVSMCVISSSVVQAADVILNEFNAVSGSRKLDDGDGQDTFFGLIDGNGGNWFELLVINDHVDMRGWMLNWVEDETVGQGNDTAAGTITLGDKQIWSDLRAGTILTFIETPDADNAGNFDTSTDISYNPEADDWWINVSTKQEQAKGADALVTTTTNDGVAGDFSVGNSDWALTILDEAGATIFGPVGEGTMDWAGGGVSSTEGGSLEGPLATPENPLTLSVWQAITPGNEFYDDTGSTSFGAPNADYDAATMTFTTVQDLSALRSPTPPPNGDFNQDGMLDAADIDMLTDAVQGGSMDAQFDLNNDGGVDGADRSVWVEDVRRTYFGDANMDGEFNSSDLVAVLGAGQYEDEVAGNSTWATGDWNGDDEFTTSDFVTALQGGGYETGPRAVAAVPEPSGIVLALISLCALFRLPSNRAVTKGNS